MVYFSSKTDEELTNEQKNCELLDRVLEGKTHIPLTHIIYTKKFVSYKFPIIKKNLYENHNDSYQYYLRILLFHKKKHFFAP